MTRPPVRFFLEKKPGGGDESVEAVAAHRPGYHLWWGHGGGDLPTEAAWVISQLMDDISTRVSLADHWDHAPAGLTKLLNKTRGYGTELPRAVLEHARTQQVDGLS